MLLDTKIHFRNLAHKENNYETNARKDLYRRLLQTLEHATSSELPCDLFGDLRNSLLWTGYSYPHYVCVLAYVSAGTMRPRFAENQNTKSDLDYLCGYCCLFCFDRHYCGCGHNVDEFGS